MMDEMDHDAEPRRDSPRQAPFSREPSASTAPSSNPHEATTSPVAAALVARKPHSKTRTGCKTCKRRKIKCDEGRPACRNCLRRGIECTYPERPPEPLSASSPTADMALHLLDLELLHNFMTSTYSTLTVDPEYRNLWRTSLSRRATRCGYVMRCLLAVSALHMLQLKPGQKHYLAHALDHHRIASQTAVELMSDIKLDDCEDLWIFSVLTLFVALGTPKTRETSLLIGDNSLGDWIFLLGGVRQLLEMLQTKTTECTFQPILDHGARYWVEAHKPEHSEADILHALSARIDKSVPDAELRAVYRETIAELRCHISIALSRLRGGESAVERRPDISDAFMWHYLAAGDFMPLMRQGKQEAVAIYAHSCIIYSSMESFRWMQGWATFLFAKAWEILDDEHRLWVQWPMEEIGWTP